MKKQNKASVVVGLQWGDEGKGKIVDVLAKNADYVVRFNGGNNAGHTVVVGSKTFKFHHLPSGAIYGKKLLIAQGAVINPQVLLEEIDQLRSEKFNPDLLIDPRVHIVMPYHKLLDSATEDWKGTRATGSLKLGIGYCYEDKNNRLGVRFEDLIDRRQLADKINSVFPLKKKIIEKVYGQKVTLTAKSIIESYAVYGRKLKRYLGDVSMLLWDNWESKKILFETAHGTFLDPAFGTYPYTVAPSSIAGALYSGAGIGPMDIYTIGVVKAYTTRVGNGPFPTELKNKTGQLLQSKGREIGTTSGRTRRCGWLDLPMLRTSVKLNNVRSLALTKLDVLSGFKEIMIGVSYLYKNKNIKYFPSEMNKLKFHTPVYKTMKGWNVEIKQIKTYKNLPGPCKKYIEFISENSGVPVGYVSVGAQRDAIIKI